MVHESLEFGLEILLRETRRRFVDAKGIEAVPSCCGRVAWDWGGDNLRGGGTL
jgi:hypothetical protein